MSPQDRSELLMDCAKLLAKSNHVLSSLQLDIKNLNSDPRKPKKATAEYNLRL